MLLLERLDIRLVRFYAELPYALEPSVVLKQLIRGRNNAVVRHHGVERLDWQKPIASRHDLQKKNRAIRHYQSELDSYTSFSFVHQRLQVERIGSPVGRWG